MDYLDEALLRLAATGPQYRGGLSNHGPMVAEALIRLGSEDAVPSWVSTYLARLEGRPGMHERITDWRPALGDVRRLGDWTRYFEDRLADAPWREVVVEWWPRLTPGLAAGSTHGVIRTSHAIRALVEEETHPRLTELAQALAYWAAAYVELPGRPLTAGVRTLEQAVAALPVLELAPTQLIDAHLGNLRDLPEFAAVVSSLRPPSHVPADLGRLSEVFAQIFLTHGRHAPIDFIHTVTVPVAVSSVLDELPETVWRPTYDAVWQVSAALFSGYAHNGTIEPLPETDPAGPAELAARATENGDAHAIKMTEAALRRHAESSAPVFLHAAARSIELLTP